MAPPRKKKKMSKKDRKKMMEERSKKALETRGLGVSGRRKFALGANWREEEYKSGDRTRVRFVSPGKTKYNTQKAAGKALVSRNLSKCFYEKSTTSEEGNTASDSDYNMDSCNEKEKKNMPCGSEQSQTETTGLEVERRLFVCESTQLMDLIHQINSSSKCSTPDCNGK